jgi:hypothetical protein
MHIYANILAQLYESVLIIWCLKQVVENEKDRARLACSPCSSDSLKSMFLSHDRPGHNKGNKKNTYIVLLYYKESWSCSCEPYQTFEACLTIDTALALETSRDWGLDVLKMSS